jgi:AsmA protein
MQKVIRYIVIGLIAGIAFLVSIVAIFVAVFDANAYKQDLTELVREATGRELQFHGDVDLTIFPVLGMKLGAMSFSNAEGFGALPMIKVKQASISVDLASLISFAPEIDKLVLRDLEINLIRNKAGVNNWDDLVLKPAPGTAAETATSASTTAAPSESDFEIKGAFGGLDLQNIKLLWLDEQAGTEFRITDLDISTGRIVPNEAFPMTMHLDASAGGEFDIVFDIKANVEYLIAEQQLTLDNMSLALNEFQVVGRVQVSNFAQPALRFDLVAENLDVDALLGTPPATATVGAPAPANTATNASTSANTASADASEDVRIELPMQILRDLDIDGSFKIGQTKIQNLRMNDVDIRVTAKNGLVALKPIKLNTYGGKVEAAIVIDVKSALPKYGVSKSIQGVQIADLLMDYAGKAAISGTLNADVNLTTSGEWLSKLKQNSNGTLQLAFLNGALNGFNLRQSIDVVRAKIRGKKPPPEKTLKTDFSSLTISGVIRKGVFSSDDLELQAPLLRVGGRGSADLNSEMVDYLVNVKLVGSIEGQQGETADKLAGLEIPVRIKGPFSDPKIEVQLEEMLKARLEVEKARLKARIEKQKAKLKQQLEAEKKALVKSRKRELKKKLEVEEAKARKKLEDKLKNLFN